MEENNKTNDKTLEKVLEGVCTFHTETGTEGGYWAFQDSRYIQKNVPRGYCKNCGVCMKEQSGSVKVQCVTISDEEVMQELKLTGVIKEKPSCANGGHEEEIGDSWSYEGLHILRNGDHLTIYHPDNNKEVWSGVINLKQHNLFTEHVSGMWIHADQIGIERDRWAEYFLKDDYPARFSEGKRNT